jgi:hypothetical protein
MTYFGIAILALVVGGAAGWFLCSVMQLVREQDAEVERRVKARRAQSPTNAAVVPNQ